MEEDFLGFKLFLLLVLTCFLLVKVFDRIAVSWFGKPLWVHFYPIKKKITLRQKQILKKEFSFYNRLSLKEQEYFEHRVVSFITTKDFIGRKDLVVTKEQKTLIAATAVLLTFGMRNYKLPIIEKIILYPDIFYSTTNEENHKGEFNPKLKALVFSWKHFQEGFQDAHDNLNLGIHEFTHAIHFNNMRYKGGMSSLFLDGFDNLNRLLRNQVLRDKMMNSGYFRAYAFTNQFEFLAVVLENFVESPQEFKREFPLVYKNIQQMLNFRFAGY